MKKIIAVFTAFIICFSIPVSCYAASNVQLNISKKNIVHKVSESLYGAFVEDISFAGDGGLVSNLVNNGSFEYSQKSDAAWRAGNLEISPSGEKPMNENNKVYEQVKVDGKGTLKNLGFTELFKYKTYTYDEELAEKADMGFKENEVYDFSCYVKNIDFNGTISVFLDSKKNSSNITQLQLKNVSTDSWTKLSAVLTSAATEDGGLSIVFDGKGTILIDCVSLVPQSSYGYDSNEWKYVTLRQDLFEALKNLSPSFIRFPGGCLAEGTDVNNIYSWKNTIGALEERAQCDNLWQDVNNGRYYVNTNSMGYHEYFQLCEDIQASPVPVVSAGLTCQGRNGYDDHIVAKQKASMSESEWNAYLVNEKGYNENDNKGIDEYTSYIESLGIKNDEDFEKYINSIAISPDSDEFTNYAQDVLDLIEYANGSSTGSYWGSLRAENGHEQPFNLKYIAIGNENWGDVYLRNFKALYKIIKSKYPDIKIVASSGAWLEGSDFDKAWQTFNSSYKDVIVDEHYYTGEKYLFEHNDRYDSYDRGGASVMVSEYSAKAQGFGTMITKNNIYSAVEEASFMTGFERNSDVVKMTSYAPTFAKINSNCWDLNMIWFDSQDIVLTPDYYNQMLFSNNLGTEYISADFSDGGNEGLYQSVTVDSSKQVLYIKIVNSKSSKKVNVSLNDFENINLVSAQILKHKYKSAANELNRQTVAPEELEINSSESGFEFTAASNSINVIRVAYGNNKGESFYHIPDTLNIKTKHYTPAKVKIGIAVILLCFGLGIAIGYLLFFKKIYKRKK